MTKATVILAVLLTAFPLTAQLTVEETKEAVIVSSKHGPTWKAVLDKTRGGAITHFHLPANGPDVTVDRFGVFSLFTMTAKGPEGRTLIKSWQSQQGRVDKVKVSERAGSIDVEVFGKSITARDEQMTEYRQKYTFLPDRIECEGESTWVFPNTPLSYSGMGFEFAPRVVAHPVRAIGPNGPVDLPIGPGSGSRMPDGLDYPFTMEVRFRHGPRVLIRAVEVPPPYLADRHYIYERPWQTDWDTRLYFEGSTMGQPGKGNNTVLYEPGKPFHYKYDLTIPAAPLPNEPPVVALVSPLQDARYYRPGATVVMTAKATDKEDGPIPAGRLNWEVWPNFGKERKMLASGTGASLKFQIPREVEVSTDFNQFWVKVATTDSAGLAGYDYFGIGVAPPYPPSPAVSSLRWNTSKTTDLGQGKLGGMAWASDDNLYAGLGSAVVRIDGSAERPRLSTVGKLPGAASSMASLGEALYALVITRPGLPPQVKLAWSNDLGATWKLSEWSFPSPGSSFYPLTFVDAGRAHSAAPDRYLYMFGATWPEGTNPCTTCRCAYLARVPSGKITDRASYEFFQWAAGERLFWARDPSRIQTLLCSPEGLDVPSVTYSPLLKRYVAAIQADGKFTVLDAPQPWGPWTTVATYETPAKPPLAWALPSKWMAPDGTIWGAFSSGGKVRLMRGSLTGK
jgi:hypothetical protein